MKKFNDFWIVKDDEGYGNALVMRTSWASRFLDVIAAHQVKIIRLNENLGWLDSDIAFLSNVPRIVGIDVISSNVTDVSPIFQMKALKTLSLHCIAKVAGDFSSLVNLKSVGLTWRNVYQSVFELNSLFRVNILGFPNNDLTIWKRNTNLTELSLASNKLQSLTGIERFPNMCTLHLSRCRKLGSLEEIVSSTSIQKLKLFQCTGILDLSPISYLTELRELEIEDCHDIRSLGPLAKCKKLELLQVAGNTTVLDGDFGTLSKLPNLRRVLLASKKHYTHSAEELERKS